MKYLTPDGKISRDEEPDKLKVGEVLTIEGLVDDEKPVRFKVKEEGNKFKMTEEIRLALAEELRKQLTLEWLAPPSLPISGV